MNNETNSPQSSETDTSLAGVSEAARVIRFAAEAGANEINDLRTQLAAAKAEVERVTRERDEGESAKRSAGEVIRELRTKLAIAGVEGSPPSGGGTIQNLLTRVRAAESRLAEAAKALEGVDQDHYDDLWNRTLTWYRGPSTKVNSGLGYGDEYGNRLRELSGDPLDTACLKAAFWEAYRTLDSKIRDALASLASAAPQGGTPK